MSVSENKNHLPIKADETFIQNWSSLYYSTCLQFKEQNNTFVLETQCVCIHHDTIHKGEVAIGSIFGHLNQTLKLFSFPDALFLIP